MNRTSWVVVLICGLFVVLLLLTPVAWQHVYYERLVHAVPIGSSVTNYEIARNLGQLGAPIGGGSLWCPLKVPGFEYTIEARVRWDTTEDKVAGYDLYWSVTLFGHVYTLDPPPPIRALF